MKNRPRLEAHIKELPALLSSSKKELLGAKAVPGNGFFLDAGAKIASRIEKLPMTPEELIRFVHTRHYMAAQSTESEASALGRLKNKLFGAFPYYAELPGQILILGYGYLEQMVPEGIVQGQSYYLRIDLTKGLSDAIKAKYKGEAALTSEVKLEEGGPTTPPKPNGPTVRR